MLGNWEVNLIERITSGFPLFLGASTNASGAMGLGANRPDRLCNGALSHHTVEKFFDTSCFVDRRPENWETRTELRSTALDLSILTSQLSSIFKSARVWT